MLISKYIKSRKYLFLLFFIITIVLLFTVDKKNVNKSSNIFKSYLKNGIKKKKLILVDVQDLKFSYLLKYKRVFFIADLHGVKEVFSANLRLAKNGEIIDIKDIKQITNTPLTDESLLYSDDLLFIYKSQFKTKKTISIIKKNTLTHLSFKKELELKVSYKNKFLVINKKKYSIAKLKSNQLFSVYKESINKDSNSYYNGLKKSIIKKNWENNFKYIKYLGVSKNKANPFKYAKVQIPNKNFFEIYFFNKKDYFIKVIDSGGVDHSKTGLFFKEKKIDTKSIRLDFNAKGGFSFDNKLVRPTVLNYSSIVVNGKNHLGYGFLKKDIEEDKLLIQFDYPLVYRGNKKVEIENLKNNLKASAKLVKRRTGLCIKNNSIAYFHLIGNRNLLTDYIYLIDCDYAFETNTSNIGNNKINNSKPKLILKPKNKLSSDIKFKNYQFLKKYTDEVLDIYSIPCGNLSLSYKTGKSDPLTSKIVNYYNQDSGISLFSGSIDQINPDALVINKDILYELKGRSAFSISKKSCEISSSFNMESNLFYREGEMVLNNNERLDVKDDKYKNILSAIGIKDDIIYLYQFKKASSYKKIYEYAKKTNVNKIIVFENSGGILNKESGKLLINSFKKGSEIYKLE